jgi:hypothetical protein
MIAIWGIGVLLGMANLMRYQMTPAARAAAPGHWPADVNFLPSTLHPTLIMTLHPRCPCSRASLHELEQIMAHSAGRLEAHVLFVVPQNAPSDWQHGDLWRIALSIPGVTLAIDKDGHAAAAFGASTSGQVMVYDIAGQLRFSGGITDGRGHEGDNDGLLSILDIVRNGRSGVVTTPVYGCSLGISSKIQH